MHYYLLSSQLLRLQRKQGRLHPSKRKQLSAPIRAIRRSGNSPLIQPHPQIGPMAYASNFRGMF